MSSQTQTDEGNHVVGDYSKSAGTSTIDTIVLDDAQDWNNGSGSYQQISIVSFLCTGTGSITMSGTVSGSPIKMGMAILSYSSDADGWDSDRLEDTASVGTSSGTSNTTGNATSAGDAVFVSALTILSNSDPTPAAGSAFTELVDNQLAGAGARMQLSVQDQIVTSGTTDAGDWDSFSASTNESIQIMCAYKEAPAAGGGGTNHHFRTTLGVS